MKNFGKMTFSPETVEQHGQDYKVLILRDENGLDWFDLVKDHPHTYYIAVNDDGLIFSMEQDYQAIQTEGTLIGIDSDFGFTRGSGGSVYGKFWNGTIIVDPSLTPDLAAYAAQKRWEKETGGVAIGGKVISTDDRSKIMISGARVAAEADPNFTTQWKGADGSFVTLDAAMIVVISNAVSTHISNCFTREAHVLAQINAGKITTTAEVDAAFT